MTKPSGSSGYCMYQRIRQPLRAETRSIFFAILVMVAMGNTSFSRRGQGRPAPVAFSL